MLFIIPSETIFEHKKYTHGWSGVPIKRYHVLPRVGCMLDSVHGMNIGSLLVKFAKAGLGSNAILR